MSDPSGEDRRVPDPVLAIILETLRKLETTVGSLRTDLHVELSRLPEMYVPRREVERRLDEHTIDIGEVRSAVEVVEERRKKDERDRRDERLADERRQQEMRRWLVATVLTALGLLVAVLGILARVG